VVHLGQNLVAFWAPFLPPFWTVDVRGFACIWTFPVIGVLVGTRFRRVFEHTFERCFERSGAPSEYGHARQIACRDQPRFEGSSSGSPLATRPEGCL
jgi:hypothetical protein